ncbi:MAG: GNAT family N-acetyltransferase [bacterium]
MLFIQWTRFTWDLKNLPDYEFQAPPHIQLRQMDAKESVHEAFDVIMRAYMTGRGWSTGLKLRLAKVQKAVECSVNDEKLTFFAIEDGSRIVGVSGAHPAADPQLVTGICILEEYRCRGYGAALLHATLKHLAAHGLQEASVITQNNIIASKFLYPKFNSRQEIIQDANEVERFLKV